MTIHGLIFRYLGWLIGPLMITGTWASWLGSTPTAWSRLLGLTVTLLWVSQLVRDVLPKASIAFLVGTLVSGGAAGFYALSEDVPSTSYATYTEPAQETSATHNTETPTYRLAVARSLAYSDPTAAISLYTELLHDDPVNVEALTYRAWLLALASRDTEPSLKALAATLSVSDLRTAIEIDSTYADAQCFLGIVTYRFLEDGPLGQQHMLQCLDMNPPSDVRRFVEAALTGMADTSRVP